MKEIYIILSHTGTILSRLIKLYTRMQYSHVSVSLDINANRMYSFGRKYPYNPFIGEFVEESTKYGMFKRFKNAEAIIFAFRITDEQYHKLSEEINMFYKNRQRYRFNMLGIIWAAFNKTFKRENYFYCAEFIKYILEKENIVNNLPEVIKPNDLITIPNLKLVYQGKLREFYE